MAIPQTVFMAQWDMYGKSAGFRRNQQMIDEGLNLAVAFPGGTGTRDMTNRVKLARISRGKSGIKAGELIPVYDHQNQVWVYYWATKSVWSKPSLMEYITRGAEQLAKLQKTTPRTVAMPAVGCGLGGLDWSEVEAELDRILGDTPGITVYMR